MKILVPLADGFEDIEAFTVIDVLKRAKIEVDVVGVIGTIVRSSHGMRVMLEKRLDMVSDDYDGIVLPGGNPGYKNLMKSSRLIEMLKNLNAQGKLIAAICGAPLVLNKAGLLENKRATVYPGLERELVYPRGDRVVVDGNIITSQGPGTAMEFALKIVEVLKGKDEALKLKDVLVV